MAGDLITCPYCDGWSPAETGMFCEVCNGEGAIWDDEPDDDYDNMEGFDAGEWNNLVNVGDELHTVLAEALSSTTRNKS